MVKLWKWLLLALVFATTFVLVYSPHLNYPYPFHVDEWHHIAKANDLAQGSFHFGRSMLEVGFHFFLASLSRMGVDLVLCYRFLPAMWAVFGAGVLFLVVYQLGASFCYQGKRLENLDRYLLAMLAVIFFSSLKSNVNILGFWFFTPLTFCIPFIYLYFYLFAKGLIEENKRKIGLSVLIMAALIPVHALSILFVLPVFLMMFVIHWRYIRREWLFFSWFVLIPLLGVVFYAFVMKVGVVEAVGVLMKELQFQRGWGVFEVRNRWTEVYSPVGYGLAMVGAVAIMGNARNHRYLYPYVVWPVSVLISILVFRWTGVSYLVPYQRNFYYFALGLPVLSAIGLYWCLGLMVKGIQVSIREGWRPWVQGVVVIGVMMAVVCGVYKDYWRLPRALGLYEVINEGDYQTLMALRAFPAVRVMAPVYFSTAMEAVTEHRPVATIYFAREARENVRRFYKARECEKKWGVLDRYGVELVVSDSGNCLKGIKGTAYQNIFRYKVPY